MKECVKLYPLGVGNWDTDTECMSTSLETDKNAAVDGLKNNYSSLNFEYPQIPYAQVFVMTG